MLTALALPPADFTRIAAGGPTGSAAGVLRAGRESRRMLRVLAAVESAEHREPSARAETTPAETALAVLDAAAAVAGVRDASLGHPSVGLWAVACAAGKTGVGHLASVAAVAAIRAGLDTGGLELTVPVHPAGVVLPGLGVLPVHGARTARVVKAPGGWEVRVAGTAHPVPDAFGDPAGWQTPQPLRLTGPTTAPHWDVVSEAADPFLAVPDARTPPLAARPRRLVTDSLAPAWRLLAERHPGPAKEVRTTVTHVVPLRRAPHTDYINATSPDAPGAVWLGLPAPAPRLAAALVHEAEHSRLAALHDVEPLYTADAAARHPVPWRDVPRPVGALLHGLYAHAAVAEFWSVEAAAGQPGAAEMLERCVRGTGAALDSFTERAALTPAGAAVVEQVAGRVRRLR